jgi:hypothetical protein
MPCLTTGKMIGVTFAKWSTSESSAAKLNFCFGSCSRCGRTRCPVLYQISHNQSKREEQQTQEKITEKAVAFSSSNAGWPKSYGNPDSQSYPEPNYIKHILSPCLQLQCVLIGCILQTLSYIFIARLIIIKRGALGAPLSKTWKTL